MAADPGGAADGSDSRSATGCEPAGWPDSSGMFCPSKCAAGPDAGTIIALPFTEYTDLVENVGEKILELNGLIYDDLRYQGEHFLRAVSPSRPAHPDALHSR